VPTHYAGAPERFERGEEGYQPRVLLVDLPEKGSVEVTSIPTNSATPFVKETISDLTELRSLADRLGPEMSRRVLGDLVVKVEDMADYPRLRDEAYELFPRLKEANTVRPEAPDTGIPVRFEATSDYTKIADPRAVFDDYFESGFSEEEIPRLRGALDNILAELEHAD
jgi:hypothetical protein